MLYFCQKPEATDNLHSKVQPVPKVYRGSVSASASSPFLKMRGHFRPRTTEFPHLHNLKCRAVMAKAKGHQTEWRTLKAGRARRKVMEFWVLQTGMHCWGCAGRSACSTPGMWLGQANAPPFFFSTVPSRMWLSVALILLNVFLCIVLFWYFYIKIIVFLSSF